MSQQVTYPPLDTLKPVTEGAWIVDSGPIAVMGFLKLPIRMTVLRLGDGSLLLHSPTRYTAPLAQELARIGQVAHLVAPNSAHWTFVKAWQEQFPAARTWAAPGLSERGQVRRSGLRIDQELQPGALPHWPEEIERITVEGAGFCEVALFFRPAKVLVLTDLIVNLEREKLPPLARPAARLTGVLAPDGKAPLYLRGIIKLKRQQPRQAARQLVALQPQAVIFSHGRWFERDAAQKLRASLAWLLD